MDYSQYTGNPEVSYNLDGVGNRVELDVGGVITSYTTNTLNQYKVISTTPLTYDVNGNLEWNGAITCTYNYANQLVKVIRSSDLLILGEYKYDCLGRRISKTNDQQLTTNYYYDGARCIEEQLTNGTTIAEYVFGNGVDEVLRSDYPTTSVQHPIAGSFYYHENSLGSIYAVTDNSGNVVERYRYEDYGKVVFLDASGNPIVASTIGNRILYTGREFDTETGLYYYRARYYSAEQGRFLSRDPAADDSLFNLYAYVYNSPNNFIDPIGLWKITRNSSMERGIAEAEAGDTFEKLAEILKLNPAEKAKWLKRLPGQFVVKATGDIIGLGETVNEDKPSSEEIFTFPNVFYVTLGDTRANFIELATNSTLEKIPLIGGLLSSPINVGSKLLRVAMDPIGRLGAWATNSGHIADEAKKNGYFVKNISSADEIEKAVQDPDIWGFSFTGHGNAGLLSGSTGAISVYKENFISTWRLDPHHGLGGVIINACGSADTPTGGISLEDSLIGGNPNAYPFKGHSGTLVPVFEHFYRWFDK